MKIDSTYKPQAGSLPAKSPAVQSSPPAAAQEAVSLSALAGSLQTSDRPPVDSARIQEIRQAISDGRFQINPEAIADRLIESARDLIDRAGKRPA